MSGGVESGEYYKWRDRSKPELDCMPRRCPPFPPETSSPFTQTTGTETMNQAKREAKPSTRRRSDGSANVAICQEVWRQAYGAASPIEIPCGSEKEANRMRTSLYNSVRNVRLYPGEYPSLVDPVNECEVVKKDGDETTLLVRRKDLSPRMRALRQILEARGVGVEAERLRGTPETREMQESIRRIAGLAEGAQGAQSNPLMPPVASHPPAPPAPAVRPSNPFFTREPD